MNIQCEKLWGTCICCRKALSLLYCRWLCMLLFSWQVLFESKQWDYLVDQFKQEFCRLYGMTLEPLLNIFLQAGLSALKTPYPFVDICAQYILLLVVISLTFYFLSRYSYHRFYGTFFKSVLFPWHHLDSVMKMIALKKILCHKRVSVNWLYHFLIQSNITQNLFAILPKNWWILRIPH